MKYRPHGNGMIEFIHNEIRSSHSTGPSLRDVSRLLEQARRANVLVEALNDTIRGDFGEPALSLMIEALAAYQGD